MPALPVGVYRVQLELAGFTNVMRENLRLEVGQSAVLSFTMTARHRSGNGHRQR